MLSVHPVRTALVVSVALIAGVPGNPSLGRCPNLLGAAHAPKLGHRETRGEGDDALELVTLSTNPPVWSVSKFLSEEECEHIIANADPDMFDSITYNDVSERSDGSGPIEDYDNAYSTHLARIDPTASPDAPDAVSLAQAKMMFSGMLDMPGLTTKQSGKILKVLDVDGSGLIERKEWQKNKRGWRKVQKLVDAFRKRTPELFTRYSKQTTIRQVGERMIRRMAILLGLPAGATNEAYQNGGSDAAFGEDLQVVQYLPGGHYNCHHDSTELASEHDMQRAYTVLFQLRTLTPAQGGQTWFPGAGLDHATTDWFEVEDRCTLNNSCANEGLVVPSVRGTAIVWLSHRSFEGNGTPWHLSGRFADLDRSSLHSGCSVTPGSEKWISNQWVWQKSIERLCEATNVASVGEDATSTSEQHAGVDMQALWANANAAALSRAESGQSRVDL